MNVFELIKNKLEEVPTEYRHEEYNNAIWDVIKFIDNIKAENDWIPCSERLPDIEDVYKRNPKLKREDVVASEYIVTIDDESWGTYSYHAIFNFEKNEFECEDDEKIIAWREYPEEYKAADKES